MVLLLALSWATGTDLFSLIDTGAGVAPTEEAAPAADESPREARMRDMVDNVAADAQAVWQRALGGRYQQTVVVLFRDATRSGCGAAQSATGPFYCPVDQKVYLDLGFFDELDQKFGARGDFAQAYVIAHEFGHHVQHLLGTTERVTPDERAGANSAAVALELQADCYAGVWGHVASQRGRFEAGGVELDPGDAEEALKAAASIGDDRLQKMSTGRVQPERFTHGSSAQRMEWFQRGMQSGDPNSCNTFAALQR